MILLKHAKMPGHAKMPEQNCFSNNAGTHELLASLIVHPGNTLHAHLSH